MQNIVLETAKWLWEIIGFLGNILKEWRQNPDWKKTEQSLKQVDEGITHGINIVVHVNAPHSNITIIPTQNHELESVYAIAQKMQKDLRTVGLLMNNKAINEEEIGDRLQTVYHEVVSALQNTNIMTLMPPLPYIKPLEIIDADPSNTTQEVLVVKVRWEIDKHSEIYRCDNSLVRHSNEWSLIVFARDEVAKIYILAMTGSRPIDVRFRVLCQDWEYRPTNNEDWRRILDVAIKRFGTPAFIDIPSQGIEGVIQRMESCSELY